MTFGLWGTETYLCDALRGGTNMTTLAISIVLPCRNEAHFIDHCLTSVFEFEPVEGGFEVLVVDGRSTDGTREKLANWEARHPEVRMLDNPRGIVPTAMNIGIRAAHGKLLVRLDVHSTYPRDYLRRCVETYQRTSADNVGGMMITMARGTSRGAMLVQALTTHRFGVGDSEFRLGAKEGPADTVPYGCFPLSLFDRAGLYDERLVRNQDYEMNCRIRRLGGVIWMNPEIAIRYYNQATLSGLLKQAVTTSAWNVWMWYIAPYTFTPRHIIPGLFAATLILAGCLSFLSLTGLVLLGSILLPYALRPRRIGTAGKEIRVVASATTPVLFLHLSHFLWNRNALGSSENAHAISARSTST